MSAEKKFKFKVCLIGENGVGKTSVIRRFAFDDFDNKYLKTIGTKVTKAEIKIQSSKNGLQDITLMIWDTMGDKDFCKLLKEAYFFGSQGIIAICDITRKSTLSGLDDWIEAVQTVTGEIMVVFLGNKCDLQNEQEIDLNELKSLASNHKNSEAYLSSAKTGFNVDLAFKTLSEKIIESML